MARKPRVEYAGATYHVMCRGDRSEPIFWDDEDRELFLTTLGDVCEKTGWKVYAYVLMKNHYHLLLKTPEPNLVAGMKWLQGTYTQRFNIRHDVYGHLFQGRYKSILVEGKSHDYVRTVANYIHLNPAKAGLLQPGEKLSDFPWSSLPAYINPSLRPEWLCCQTLLDTYYRKDDAKGRAFYKRSLNQRGMKIQSAPEEKRVGLDLDLSAWCFGSEEFQEEVKKRLDSVFQGKQGESYSGRAKQEHGELTATHLLERALQALDMSLADMRALPYNDLRKAAVAWIIRKKTTVLAEWVTDCLNMGHRVNVSRAMGKMNRSTVAEVEELKRLMLKCTD